MRINRQKMELAMARACVGFTDLRDTLSSATIAKIRNRPDQEVNIKTIGRLAKALGVDVTEITEQEVCSCSQR